MASWTVVQFLEDNSVEAVPITWLSADGKSCYWPAFKCKKKTNRAIRNHEPVQGKWILHDIKRFHDAVYEFRVIRKLASSEENTNLDNYLVARNKCEKAQYNSDLNSDVEGKRKSSINASQLLNNSAKKPLARTHRMRSSTSEEESDTSDNSQQLKPPPLKRNVPQLVEEDELDQDDVFETEPPQLPEKIQSALNCRTHCECCKYVKDCMPKILSHLTLIKSCYQDLAADVTILKQRNVEKPTTINSDESTHDQTLFEVLSQLPVTTHAEFDELEEYLSNKTNFNSAVAKLSYAGGDNVEEFAKRISKRLIANAFARGLNLFGKERKDQPKKRGIIDTNYLRLIKDCVRNSGNSSYKHTSEKDVEKAVAYWLKRASERKN